MTYLQKWTGQPSVTFARPWMAIDVITAVRDCLLYADSQARLRKQATLLKLFSAFEVLESVAIYIL